MEEAITFIAFSLNQNVECVLIDSFTFFCFLLLWLLATKSAKLLNS